MPAQKKQSTDSVGPANPSRGDGVVRRYGLVVGVSTYELGDPDKTTLRYCTNDAKLVGRSLAARGYLVRAMHDDAARPSLLPTRRNVLRVLQAMVRIADEDDLLFVHFSCHGKLVDNRPYLVLRDSPMDDPWPPTAEPRRPEEEGLALATVFEVLRKGRSRWVAIFLDACRIGLGIDPTAVLSAQEIERRAGGFALLAGSTSAQQTQDSDILGAGVFSSAVAEGLSGAAADEDGTVMFSRLAQHVQRKVAEWKKSEEGLSKAGKQHPVLRMELADLEIAPPLGYIELVGGHSGPLAWSEMSNKIRAAAFSPDGRWLATSGEDNTVRLWRPSTGKPGPGPMKHDGHVGGVAFSHDSILISSASNDGTTRLWQASGASAVSPSPEPMQARVHAVAYSPDGRYFASASDLGVHLYDARQPSHPVHTWNDHEGTAWAIAFSPDSRWLVSGGNDGTARVFRVATGKAAGSVATGGPVWAVAFTRDGKRIVTAGADSPSQATLANVPKIWCWPQGELVFELRGHSRAVTAVAISPNGALFATTSYDGTARLWNSEDGSQLGVFGEANIAESYGAAFSPDGRLLFVGYANGRGLLYKLSARDAPGEINAGTG